MVVRKAPKEEEKKGKVDVDYLISKGAPVKEDEVEYKDLDQVIDEKKRCSLNLRVPTQLVKQIDEVLKKRIGISRTGWILEAIQEKLMSLKQ